MRYVFPETPEIFFPKKAEHPVISELLSNYTYGKKWAVSFAGDDNGIKMGNCEKAGYDGAEYVINVTGNGVYIGGADHSSLMRGFTTFLERIKYNEKDKNFYIENCLVKEKPLVDFRCVHLCVFPETSLEFLTKCVRSCAVVKFSHIILEFWGMLKFDCFKESGWSFAYTKEQVRKIVSEANALGVEIIPMFNHLGHASGCRGVSGKHVVLDQNPSLAYLYDSYGWAWNIRRADVKNLHKKMREELIGLCGEGKYFHIGCDEEHSYGHDEIKAYEMCKYLNEVSDDLIKQGRRPIIWHDMLLDKGEFEGYVANSDKNISDILMKNLDRNIIIADWQYDLRREIWRSSKKFKENGFDVLCCPWDNWDNIAGAVDTVVSNDLFGIIQTTWHTLHYGFRGMIFGGKLSYGGKKEDDPIIKGCYCAEVARKVMPSGGIYEKSGWSERMTGAGID